MKRAALLAALLAGCASAPTPVKTLALGYDTRPDVTLQRELDAIDARLRAHLGMSDADAAAGVLDLTSGRVAMIHPDRIEYAASVPKVGILLAWFALHPDWKGRLDAATRRDLGLMAKVSDNEAASKFSRLMGLREIQRVLDGYGFYDAARGGGIWVGKHYGKDSERIGDPVADHSHAATVRQLLRFWLLLTQGKLVSPEASAEMRGIFASPEIPHSDVKFVKALAGRDLDILRKWGSWEEWQHDSAVITGAGRRYVLVGLTHHARGDEYLEGLARSVDDLMAR